MARVLISGTGLIGTSIALALRDLGWETLGWDPDPQALAGAVRVGALTPVESVEAAGLEAGDLLVLAGPPSAVRSSLRDLDTPALVIDVASVKAPIVEAAGTDRFVGTHPMAGREVTGPDSARSNLFRGATWVVVPDGSDESDVRIVESIVSDLGARPVRMSASDHDAAVARISHLPQIVAAALLDGAGEVDGAMDLAAGSFRDLTRVAASDPATWMDILTTNRGEVVAAVETLRDRLATLATSDEDLEATLVEARRLRATLMPGVAVVRVALEDRPGEIATVGRALAETGIDVRDLQLRHAPYGGGGILTVSVRSGEEDAFREALEASGLTTIAASDERG